MSIYSGAPLSEVSPSRGSKENERPTKLLYPSGGSYFVEGTGSDKLALQGVTSEHSGATHDGSFGGGGGPDHESLDKLLATLEAEDGGQIPIAEEVVPVGASQKIPDDWLKTDPAIGLTHDQALQRRRKCGWNQMKEKKRNIFKQFFMFFVGPIQFVMEAACVLAAYLWDWVDLGVIVGLLLLNAVIGFTQDYTAGNIVKELQNDLSLKCDVRRNGVLDLVEAIALVPGDIVHLEEGTIVPADGRIVTKDAHLQVDQSAMTGESLAVNKHVGEVIYQSSTIKRGESFMIVTDTGDSTFVGRSAALVNAASAGKGHFTEVLGSIGRRLLGLVVATLFVVWVSCFYRSLHLTKILTFTLAITIIGVPVGLPAVVTTTMAVGAAVLARKKAIVQNLAAIESLAGVEILCTDKTGTLTQNKLSLSEPYTVGNIQPDELMLVACLAASRKEKGLDAIDKALLKALKHYPLTKDMIPTFKVLEFTPFDPVSKRATSVVRSPRGEHIICVKGAPAIIIKLVSEVDGVIPEETATEYNNKVAEFARRGFRSLGVARKRAGSHWELLGIVPCSDPPRHDTAKTMAEAIELGLRIKMLTGDAVGIAKETSRQLGLGENIYNSERLGLGGGGELPGHKFFDFVEAADGFAEVFPQHKYSVVDMLQMRGYLVAMTGDGVNDAPSLKRADAGIAVEGASDAARSAADIVFREPGLSAIIDAIKTSRQIFHRMYAYVVYRIALSLHLEIFLGLWIAIYNQSLKIQLVVFIAIFADIATLAIAYDKAPFSRSPVKWNLPKMWGISIILGIILAAGSWICLSTTLNKRLGMGIIQEKGPVHSVLFLEIVLTENWLILITRAGAQPFWTSVPSWQLVLAILLVDALATLFCVLGWFNVPEWTDTVVMTSASTIIRVWVFSLGVFFAMAGVYYLLADSQAFDRLMHGQWPCRRTRKDRRRSYELEDIVVAMQRTLNVHESVV